MLKLKVDLGERSYPIFIGSNILAEIAEIYSLYNPGGRAVVVTNTTLDKLYGHVLEQSFAKKPLMKIAIGDGERFKTLKTAEHIYTKLIEAGCDRSTTIIALGGGVIGDIAGFVAATYMRGVPFIQVPTSLLAQVDSSVGGKVAVNHRLGKNMIGAFYQPQLVWIDVELLKSLPKRELISGLGEVIKYGIIWDRDFFKYVETNLDKILQLDRDILSPVVKRCCEIKAEVVSRDEKERDLRRILNFGHTIGHALETATRYRRFRHGEAVILGMLAAAKMAVEMNVLAPDEFERLQMLLGKISIKGKMDDLSIRDLKNIMIKDKKAKEGKPRFVLPEHIGKVFVIDQVEEQIVTVALKYILSRSQS